MIWTVTDETTDPKGFQLQTTKFGELSIHQLRSPRAASDAEFLPARVVFNDKEVWSFSADHKSRGFTGMAFLREVGDELVIILATRSELYEVLPVRDLPHMQRIGDERIGGRKLKELVALKSLIASDSGLEPVWSRRELALQQASAKAAASAQQEAKKVAEEAVEQQRAERRAARDAKRAEITGRQRIFAHTFAGDRRHGHPVVGEEWMALGNGAFCISVTSYDRQTGAVGELIESFMVVKKNGAHPERQAVTAVTLQTQALSSKTAPVLQHLTFQMVPMKGDMEEVILVESMDSVRALRDHGLNSGTLAMCPKANDPGRYSVFRLTEGKIEPVTEVMRKGA